MLYLIVFKQLPHKEQPAKSKEQHLFWIKSGTFWTTTGFGSFI